MHSNYDPWGAPRYNNYFDREDPVRRAAPPSSWSPPWEKPEPVMPSLDANGYAVAFASNLRRMGVVVPMTATYRQVLRFATKHNVVTRDRDGNRRFPVLIATNFTPTFMLLSNRAMRQMFRRGM